LFLVLDGRYSDSSAQDWREELLALTSSEMWMNAIGGLEEFLPGRLNLDKTLVVVAAQEDGPGIGRIRMRQILDASAETSSFRGGFGGPRQRYPHRWLGGYQPLTSRATSTRSQSLRGKRRRHRNSTARSLVISLLKRWLFGTHQGTLSQKHLDYYLDQFTVVGGFEIRGLPRRLAVRRIAR